MEQCPPDKLLLPEHPAAWVELPVGAGYPAAHMRFDRPELVWQANETAEVRVALERVEAMQRAGRFVVGFIAYEAAPAFDPAFRVVARSRLPLCRFAAFDPANVSMPSHLTAPETVCGVSEPAVAISRDAYRNAVRRVLVHIRAGDIYQANYTVRARAAFVGLPFDLFRTLQAAAPVPHAAYLDGGDFHVVSLSPELFLRRRGGMIESRPMKGTAPRGPSWAADEAARLILAADEKNQAENVMIVDLMRNDLGRVCRPGTVTVPELFTVTRYTTVHQMTSLVRGQLRDGISLWEIFAATFPPGSVTGAPKIRACEIIAELEAEPRGIYCGTIGVFLPGGDFLCSVAIRTLLAEQAADDSFIAQMGIGSGIVADSDPAVEWAETLLKGEFVRRRPQPFALYETLRYEPGRGYLDLAAHLRRLRQSCVYFCRPFPLANILRELRAHRATLQGRTARLRLDVAGDRVTLKSSAENLAWPSDLVLMIADERLDPADFRLYHKTTLRPEKYAALQQAEALGAAECLFLNTRGELTEGALSNLFAHVYGEWLTPAVQCGLLPGVWREKQLRNGRCREAILTLDDLRNAAEIRIGNAVRGEQAVTRIVDYTGSEVWITQQN